MALTSHVNEDAAVSQPQTDNSAASAAKAGVPIAPVTLEGVDDEEEKKDEKDTSDATAEKDDKEEKEEDSIYTIKDVEVVPDEGDKDDDKESDDKKDDEDDEKSDKEDDKKEGEQEEKTDECDANASKDEKEATASNKLFDKKEEIKSRQSEFAKKFEELVNAVKKEKTVTESARESVMQEFPFAAYLSESAVCEFSQMDVEQKRKVANYLKENRATDAKTIERIWKNGLNENANSEPNWLKYADQEYRQLYEAATDVEKRNLQETAKFLILESQEDIDRFWLNSGLKSKAQRQMMYESYCHSNPIYTPQVNQESSLPYSMSGIKEAFSAYKMR